MREQQQGVTIQISDQGGITFGKTVEEAESAAPGVIQQRQAGFQCAGEQRFKIGCGSVFHGIIVIGLAILMTHLLPGRQP